MPNRHCARNGVVPEGGNQTIKIAGDDVAAIPPPSLFIPGKEMIERRPGREIG
ncbi:MAG TPA: hypothetical protein VMS01_13620 [Stellaceae bacterium]|nr:hypothetical protein [Stellaceae bacterium]